MFVKANKRRCIPRFNSTKTILNNDGSAIDIACAIVHPLTVDWPTLETVHL